MGALALLCRCLGGPLTAKLLSFAGKPERRAQIKALLSSQQRDVIRPLLMGFLAKPFDIACLPGVAAPTLLLAHPGDPLHPLRSARILDDRLPNSRLVIAPSKTHWNDDLPGLAAAIVAWVKGEPS